MYMGGHNNAETIKGLIASKDVFLLDGDGTLYQWDKAEKDAGLFIKKLAELKKKFIILSNNDSESKQKRLGFLRNVLHVELSADQLLLPNDIVQDFMVKKQMKDFDGLVSNDLERELVKNGFRHNEKDPDVVIIGFDVDLDYSKILRIIKHVNNGVKFVLTHIDPLCPYEGGKQIPDAGLIVKMVSEATKKEPYEIFGKPYRSTIDYIVKKYGYRRERMVVVGDRINTDIRMADENALSSIWISHNEKLDKLKDKYRPDASVPSMSALYDIIARK